MSFQTNTIWSNSEFQSSKFQWNNLAIIDNIDGKGIYAISSLSGQLHIFKSEDVIFSRNFKRPILQLVTGNFISALKKKVLVILQPYNISINYLDYNDNTGHYNLCTAFIHDLKDLAYSMTADNCKIFISSLYNNSVSILEQESLLFTRLLESKPNILPSEIVHVPSRDLVLVYNLASRKINAYIQGNLATTRDSELPVKDWSYILPDSPGLLKVMVLPGNIFQTQNSKNNNQENQNNYSDIICVISNHHITKLNDMGQVLFQFRLNIDERITAACSVKNKPNLILVTKDQKCQIINLQQNTIIWSGRIKTEKEVVSINCTSFGELICLERDGVVSKHVFGAVKVHPNLNSVTESAAQDINNKLSKFENQGMNFKEIQEKLKKVYKSIQLSNSGIRAGTEGNNFVNSQSNSKLSCCLEYQNNPTSSLSGDSELILTVTTNNPNADLSRELTVSVNPPLVAEKSMRKQSNTEIVYRIHCSPSNNNKTLSSTINEINITCKNSSNNNKIPEIIFEKMIIPSNFLQRLIFIRSSNLDSSLDNAIPYKITLSNSIKDLLFYDFKNEHDGFYEFRAKFDSNYKMQLIPAKSGNDRTRLQLSNISLLPFLLQNLYQNDGKQVTITGSTNDLHLEGKPPLDNIINIYKKYLKNAKKLTKIKNHVEKLNDFVKENQLILIKNCKDLDDQTQLDGQFEQLDQDILLLSEHIDHFTNVQLESQKISYDLYGAMWVFDYWVAKKYSEGHNIIPKICPQQPFKKLSEWNIYFENVFYDKEDREEDGRNLEAGGLKEKMEKFYNRSCGEPINRDKRISNDQVLSV